MKISSITFSPTGGTQKIIDLIMEEFAGDKKQISLLPDEDYSAYAFAKEDVCIIAIPSFGGRVPQTAVTRLLQLKGNGAKCVLVCVYGNRAYDDTLLELKNTVKKSGFIPIAAITAIAEHSIMRQFAKDRPDVKDQVRIKEYAKKIHEEIAKSTNLKEVEVPGNDEYRKYEGVPLTPHGNGKCTACGICAKECPVDAIDKNNPKKTNKNLCISCMRCISVCPMKARGLNGMKLKVSSSLMKKAFVERKEAELYIGAK